MTDGVATGEGAGSSAPDGAVSPAPDRAALLALAERIARAAGDLVRDQRPDSLRVSSTKSSPTDVVTAMDLAAEALLRSELARERPDDGVLGEEEGLRAGTSGLTWVLDPIDGTVNYLYGLPAYAVSVAVVTAGDGGPDAPLGPLTWEVLAGCVHNPATGETWTASAGSGAHLDGRSLTPLVPEPADAAPTDPGRADPAEQARGRLAGALVGTGFGYRSQVRTEQAGIVAALLPLVRDVRRIGSAALDLCAVGSGRLDLYYERGLRPWDMAAGSLVVTEAGGVVEHLPDGTLVAGPPALARDMAAVLGSLAPPA